MGPIQQQGGSLWICWWKLCYQFLKWVVREKLWITNWTGEKMKSERWDHAPLGHRWSEETCLRWGCVMLTTYQAGLREKGLSKEGRWFFGNGSWTEAFKFVSDMWWACGGQTPGAGESEVTLHLPAWANWSFQETTAFILGLNMVWIFKHQK